MKHCLFLSVATGATLLLPLLSGIGQTAEEITREKILATAPEWQEKYDRYEPAADMVDALKAKAGSGMRIDVYLGLWCVDSRNNVPPFIKILDRLGSGVPVRYLGLPRKANKEAQYFVADLKVERVPTFIVYRDEREIGRIVENPKIGLMEDLMEIVFK